MNHRRSPVACLAPAWAGFVPSPASCAGEGGIRLVPPVTVDGLRGELVHRYADCFGKGGFRLLPERGTVYTDARYPDADRETIVGHAAPASGTRPAEHRMVGNVRYDRDDGGPACDIALVEVLP